MFLSALVLSVSAWASTPIGGMTWFEIPVKEFSKAEHFYSELLGWSFQEAGPGFKTISNHEGMIGGLVESAEATRGAGIILFFSVEDTEVSHAKALALGATSEVAPTGIPKTGTYAIIKDLDGNRLGLFSEKEIPVK